MVERRRVHLSQFHQTRRPIVCHIITITEKKETKKKNTEETIAWALSVHGVCDCYSMKRNALLYCIVLDEDQSKRLICGEWFDCDERTGCIAFTSYTRIDSTNERITDRNDLLPSIRRLPLSAQSQSNLERMCLFFCLCNGNGKTEPICSRSTHFRFVFCLFGMATAARAGAVVYELGIDNGLCDIQNVTN